MGGDGSGQKFTKVGGQFVPQKGYHTELVENADGSYDFYTKGRIRYHYMDPEMFVGDRTYGGRPSLEFIEDHEREPHRAHLRRAAQHHRGEGGLSRWCHRALADLRRTKQVDGEERLARVQGPLGLEVTYEYDRYGNLIRATRDERVEEYSYDTANDLDQHNLIAYTDPNGNTTRYRYYSPGRCVPGRSGGRPACRQVRVGESGVDEPEGVTTSFVYDLTRLTSGEFVTTVTDGRRNDTIYTLNLNGSPLAIEEPGGPRDDDDVGRRRHLQDERDRRQRLV